MFEGLLQPTHLIVILAIALLVFGPKKLPELGKGLGESIRGFKDAMSGASDAAKEAAKGAAASSTTEKPGSTGTPEPPKQ
jgi:sec-independent protein translocase protein TatA